MEDLLEKVTAELHLDKSRWQLTKFGDVAIQQKKTIDRDDTNLTQYVKGEHMGTEDIHLREWGELTDEYLGPAFIRKFEEGDVLYGSRRTYLKKVVVAPFEGITSNTTFVIKANEKRLDKRLLPFIMLSEGFTNNSIKNSKGSVNPYINWKDIANYEFLLPPKDQQAQLAELLWAMDEVIEREREVLERLIVNKKSFEARNLLKFYSGIQDNLPNGYQVMRLGEIAEISGGSTPSRDVEKFWNGDIPWLTPTDVTNHNRINLSHTKEKITEIGLKSISNRLYPPGSILYCSRATIGFAIINDVPMSTNQGFSNFIVNEKVSNYFLYFLLKHITPELTKLAGGSTFLEISKSAIRNFKVIVPSLDIQGYIELKLLEFENNRITIESKRIASKALQKSLINQIF
jgi:type I restriction enzyme S subunit